MLLTPDALNAALDALAHGSSGDPFAILGPHVVHTGGTSRVVILTIQPTAARVEVVRRPGDERTLVDAAAAAGSFAAQAWRGADSIIAWRPTMDGQTFELDDPSAWSGDGRARPPPAGEGRHYRA
jgi:hypothetical protein